jgi:hypothetical protein
MFFQTFFLLTEKDFKENIHLPANCYFTYKVDLAKETEINDTYKTIYSSQRYAPFCLYLYSINKELPNEKLIDYLISITFHYNYLKVGLEIPFFIFDILHEEKEKIISLFIERFNAQGYDNIRYVHADKIGGSNTGYSKINHAYFDGSLDNDFFSYYFERIMNRSKNDHPLIISVNSDIEIVAILSKIEAAEKELEIQDQHLYNSLKKIMELEVTNNNLIDQIHIRQTRIESLENYVSSANAPESVYKKKMKDILKFYETEYEILPIWYKRFGHIIKVIMGKRTFKSLFNDNVKKYKD